MGMHSGVWAAECSASKPSILLGGSNQSSECPVKSHRDAPNQSSECPMKSHRDAPFSARGAPCQAVLHHGTGKLQPTPGTSGTERESEINTQLHTWVHNPFLLSSAQSQEPEPPVLHLVL